VLNGDGAGQSVTSADATDKAGNVAAGITVGGIDIDSRAPVTTADTQCVRSNDWCTGNTATVVLKATDGLSGVREIHYAVNDGTPQVAAGDTVSIPVALSGTGRASVAFWSVDKAGNAETVQGASLKWDDIAPTVSHAVNPIANADGWNNDNLTVHFSAVDDAGGSGVDASTVTPDVAVSAETASRIVNGSAKDLAGNLGTDKVEVKLDRTAPAISGAVVSGTKGLGGWYTGPVTVHFTCADPLSGVAVCPADVVLTENKAGQSVTGTAIDKAGNSASTTVSGIDIDQAGPAVQVNGVKDGAIYTLGAVPTASCTATDGTSGVSGCSVTVTGGTPTGAGTFAFTATATDKAGNSTTVTGSYKVQYRFDGFLQPINDTAHQVGAATSIFKGGSTVPAKFQLKKADGTVVQAATAPQWLAPVKGSAITAPVNESAYSAVGDTAGTYRWDGSQYIYNWNTASSQAGAYWRVGVKLDDGTTQYVNLGLR
jgi:fibronectin type 3 domain-containing protein